MLSLARPTEPSWAAWAWAHEPEILIDHAHCEMKAASTAMSLVFRYSQHDWLAAHLSRFAREELAHFEAVLALLERRGIRFRGLSPSPYARRLREFVRPDEPHQLIDTLLCCALIEARSCERFKLLAQTAPDAELASFFERLLAAEARHHHDFVSFAERIAELPLKRSGRRAAEEQSVRLRLRLAALHEARALETSSDEPRLHSGGLAGRQRTEASAP